MQADKTLNIKGEVCPYTFVKTKLAMMSMRSGQVIEVIVDHLPATANVPRSAELEGHKVLGVEQLNPSDWRIVLQKK